MPTTKPSNIPFMYFSLWHWARMVNGYSGFIPKSYADFQKEMAALPGRCAASTRSAAEA